MGSLDNVRDVLRLYEISMGTDRNSIAFYSYFFSLDSPLLERTICNPVGTALFGLRMYCRFGGLKCYSEYAE